MIGFSVGTGNLPASYELWLIVHRKGEILCLFQKKHDCSSCCKTGAKGELPLKVLKRSLHERLYRVKEVLLSLSPVEDLLGSVTVWGFSRMSLSSGSPEFCINLTVLFKEAFCLNYSPLW